MKLAVVMAVTILAAVFISGCGSSDKFAGEWTGTGAITRPILTVL